MTDTVFKSRDSLAPTPAAVVTEDDRKALAAARRALPMQRLVGNGMDYSDAAALHCMAEQGIAWIPAATFLGEANLERAEEALACNNLRTAADYLRLASACFRFGQSTIYFDDQEKCRLYARALEAFTRAAALDVPVTEKLEVMVGDATLSGWLMRPAHSGTGAVVLIFGGADGWREEYHSGARYLLDRGIGAFLVDGLGQGETRILRHHYLTVGPEKFYSAVADHLLDNGYAERVGVWGNSLGGNFAARTAIANSRIRACCVNGGASSPTEVLENFPKFIDRICAMMGHRDQAAARDLMAGLDLGETASNLRCSLLVVHGGQDPIFSVANALSIHDTAAASDKTALVWEDGDHCIYNHSHDKHSRIADWFARQLGI
ncbi:alpha/beta hydrolase family protein DUF1100 [Rhizobium sp. SJZ105]|uniref:alpha/beta hydrolase family protein n=1 Tax=Rhizobium sp. SJZ105 TaxID=2572678 RepID=UPI0011A4E767|nr:prolyl oligopeptidase family serine peptidase [Rhizobium sp. SJZ105]TWC76449.1 alpha/beta hydrolase family protein DUF1100 [Rhizobium sp. SJZ105]